MAVPPWARASCEGGGHPGWVEEELGGRKQGPRVLGVVWCPEVRPRCIASMAHVAWRGSSSSTRQGLPHPHPHPTTTWSPTGLCPPSHCRPLLQSCWFGSWTITTRAAGPSPKEGRPSIGRSRTAGSCSAHARPLKRPAYDGRCCSSRGAEAPSGWPWRCCHPGAEAPGSSFLGGGAWLAMTATCANSNCSFASQGERRSAPLLFKC